MLKLPNNHLSNLSTDYEKKHISKHNLSKVDKKAYFNIASYKKKGTCWYKDKPILTFKHVKKNYINKHSQREIIACLTLSRAPIATLIDHCT